MLPKAEPYTLGKRGSAGTMQAGKVVAEVPDTDATDEDLASFGRNTRQRLSGIRSGRFLWTRSARNRVMPPGASVSVGLQSPIVMQNADGSYSMMQPANKPGYEAQVTQFPAGMKPATEAKPPTAEQASAAGYSLRMQRAEQIMGNLSKQGESGKPGFGEIAAGSVPFVGGPTLENAARTPGRQLYQQAQEDWVRAKLRKESGAVIGEPEMQREITTYFPQPFDSPERIEQKRKARATAIEAMNIGAGGSTQRAPGAPAQSVQDAAREELRRRQQGGR